MNQPRADLAKRHLVGHLVGVPLVVGCVWWLGLAPQEPVVRSIQLSCAVVHYLVTAIVLGFASRRPESVLGPAAADGAEPRPVLADRAVWLLGAVALIAVSAFGRMEPDMGSAEKVARLVRYQWASVAVALLLALAVVAIVLGLRKRRPQRVGFIPDAAFGLLFVSVAVGTAAYTAKVTARVATYVDTTPRLVDARGWNPRPSRTPIAASFASEDESQTLFLLTQRVPEEGDARCASFARGMLEGMLEKTHPATIDAFEPLPSTERLRCRFTARAVFPEGQNLVETGYRVCVGLSYFFIYAWAGERLITAERLPDHVPCPAARL